MKKKQNAIAKQPKKETAEANDKRTPARKSKLVKVEITGMVAWLGLPHAIGQIAELEAKQAEEVVKAKRGKYVK